MPQTTLNRPPENAQNKIDQTHKVLSIVSTSLGILGAAGTVFVGLVINFYVGDVEVKPDKPLDAVVVKAYDNKGHEAAFHSTHFQIMPGNYSLDIIPDSGQTMHADAQVRFHETTLVPVVVPVAVPEREAQDQAEVPQSKPAKAHWWQFWRY